MGGAFPETALAVAVESDGRIVLGGFTDSPSGGFALAGLLANGSPGPFLRCRRQGASFRPARSATR